MNFEGIVSSMCIEEIGDEIWKTETRTLNEGSLKQVGNERGNRLKTKATADPRHSSGAAYQRRERMFRT